MPQRVQSTHASSGTAATSRSIAYPSNLTAGNLLVLAYYFESATVTVSSVADTLGHTWIAIGTKRTSGNNTSGQLYYVANCSAGANTVTVTYSASVINGFAIYEFSGAATVSPLRGHAEAIGTSANPSSGALDVAPVAGDLLFGHCISNITPSVGSGYTAGETAVGFNDTAQEEYKTAVSETAVVWTLAGTPTWSAYGAAFAPTARINLAPNADVSAGTWTSSAGGSLFSAIDEATTDDTDFIQSAAVPVNDVSEVALTDPATTQPGTTTMVIRAKKV